MPKTTIYQTPPRTTLPRQDFVPEDFESLIWQKGSAVYYEPAIPCPCKLEGRDNLPNCHNCGGLGWVFLNKTETRMILKGINKNTQYKDWTEEKIGQVSISASKEISFGYMDKITIINGSSTHTQNIYPKLDENKRILYYVVYNIDSIEECFLFIDPNIKLTKLYENVDFIFQDNIFLLNYDKYKNLIIPNKPLKVSIRYRHKPVFFVLDNVRDMIVSFILNGDGNENPISLPVSAIGKRAHEVIDKINIDNSEETFDNSYPPPLKPHCNGN